MESVHGSSTSRPPAPVIQPPQEDGGCTDEEQVMSEIHLGCPPNVPGPRISCFTVALPPRDEWVSHCGDVNTTSDVSYAMDEDGDLILVRRNESPSPNHSLVFRVQHNVTSTLPMVGLQVWRAELVLADFVYHQMTNSSNWDGIVAVELGCGTGLVGMILAIGANTVFLTDHGEEVLGNCAQSVHLNSGIFNPESSIRIRELDWRGSWPPLDVGQSKLSSDIIHPTPYTWSSADIKDLEKASMLFAADVIYSDDLTDAFFSLLESIMSTDPEKVLYLALEKRYNFTMDDLDVVANGYSHFLSFIQHEQSQQEQDGFIGKLVNFVDIPHYLRGYDRGKDVEIWEIRYMKTHRSITS